MDLDQARDFVREHHQAVMGTYRPDGTIQLSAVGVTVDGEGRLVVSTQGTTVKARNLRRDPRAALCVLADGIYGGWVTVHGRVSIVELPEAMEPLVDYYRRISGEHPDWDDYRAAMEREGRVLLRLDLERAAGA